MRSLGIAIEAIIYHVYLVNPFVLPSSTFLFVQNRDRWDGSKRDSGFDRGKAIYIHVFVSTSTALRSITMSPFTDQR